MKRASEFIDPINGRPAQEWHHVTGRDSNERYFNSGLIIPMSITIHNRIHQCWSVEYGDCAVGDPLLIQLFRHGNLWTSLGANAPEATINLPVITVLETGRDLLRLWQQIKVERK